VCGHLQLARPVIFAPGVLALHVCARTLILRACLLGAQPCSALHARIWACSRVTAPRCAGPSTAVSPSRQSSAMRWSGAWHSVLPLRLLPLLSSLHPGLISSTLRYTLSLPRGTLVGCREQATSRALSLVILIISSLSLSLSHFLTRSPRHRKEPGRTGTSAWCLLACLMPACLRHLFRATPVVCT